MSASASRVLTVRRPLVRSAEGRLLHVVRGWLLRRALVLGVALVVLCVARVWLTHQVRGVAYDLSEARRIQLRLEHEQRELELELATLRDPRRLGADARRRLGLVEPARGQVVVLP
jgi:cell division protein FtsL